MPDASIRTFIALPIGADTRCRLQQLTANLSHELAGFKWTKPDQLHLTLAFLGDVEAAKLDGVSQAVAGAARDAQPFSIRWQGIGGFPKPNRAHILWAGVREGEQSLVLLQRAVATALAQSGFPSDDRFTPHITLARAKRFGGRAADLRPFIERFSKTEFGLDRVSEIVVMKSDCRPTGSVYTPLTTISLAAD